MRMRRAQPTLFTNAGAFSTLSAMATGVSADLTATNHYVFAVYNGTQDINNNGIADDHGAGVLAYGDNGGITSVLMLPGVGSVTPTDLA